MLMLPTGPKYLVVFLNSVFCADADDACILIIDKARLSVATSPSPTGPFTLVTEQAAIEV